MTAECKACGGGETMKYTPPKHVLFEDPIPPVRPINADEEGRTMYRFIDPPWNVYVDGNKFTFLPKGYDNCTEDLLTDFRSSPRPTWVVFNPTDRKAMGPSAFHDECYRAGFDKRWSDDCYRLGLEANGIWKIQSNIEWLCVSSPLGQIAYNKNSEELRQHTRRHILLNDKPIPATG